MEFDKAASPADVIDPRVHPTPGTFEEARFDICKSCDEFVKETSQCNQCFCYMKMKVKLHYASCPLGKWDSVLGV